MPNANGTKAKATTATRKSTPKSASAKAKAEGKEPKPKKERVAKPKKEKVVSPYAPARSLAKGETVKCAVTGETVGDAFFVGTTAVGMNAADSIRRQIRKRMRIARKAKKENAAKKATSAAA